MGASLEKRRYSIAEYLELERASEEKHEYWDGEVIAMSGGSEKHSLVSANLIRELGNHLKGKPCRVYESNLRIRIPRTPLYVYPDATVICGPTQVDPTDPHMETITNPLLLVEVLSPTTEIYDRSKKFKRYLQIDSLREYVLISQFEPRAEVYSRQPDGSWLFTHFVGLDSKAKFLSIGAEIPLAEIYANVEFTAQE